jgi:hypothetical protein
MRSNERSAVSDWRAVEAAQARQRRIVHRQPGGVQRVGTLGIHGDGPHREAGLERILGVQRDHGIHRATLARRPDVRAVAGGRRQHLAQHGEEFATVGA